MTDKLITLVNQAGSSHLSMVAKGVNSICIQKIGVGRHPVAYPVRKHLMYQYFFADKDL